MKPTEFEQMTMNELVDRFVEIGIAQDQALLYDDHKTFNRLYGQMDRVDGELRRRGPEARLALVSLYDHANIQVRLKAAVRTLGVAPTAARTVIQAIYDSRLQPQALAAGMTLRSLDSGAFKPD